MNCSTFVAPDCSSSLRVITWTGSALSPSMRLMLEPVTSSRGLVYDRNGDLLVSNVPSFSVKVRPGDIPSSDRDEVVGRLASMLGMDPGDINVLIDWPDTGRHGRGP